MKIEIKDGQRKVVAPGAKSLRVVSSEEHIQKMSNGSLIAYRKRVLMYSKWIGSRLRNWDPDFTYENNKEVIDTVYWLRKAVNREWTRRNNAAYEAHKKAIAKSGDWRKRFPRRWYKSEYAEAYKND